MTTIGLGLATVVVVVVGLAIAQSKRHADAPQSATTLKMNEMTRK